MLLVAPFRPQRTWLPLLHRLNRRAPWRLPAGENSSRLGGWIRPAWMRECHPPGYSITEESCFPTGVQVRVKTQCVALRLRFWGVLPSLLGRGRSHSTPKAFVMSTR